MIIEVEGDILLSKAQAIVHGIAPNDDFKQGLALSLRKQWPALYKDFRHYCHTTHAKTGELWVWQGVGNFMCINLFTQEEPKFKGGHAGRASVENVNHCMRALSKYVEDNDVKSFAITKIATGVGGLDWSDVKPLIQKYFSDSPVKVYVYSRYVKDVIADEA